jgi:hypothetical protein
MNKHMRIVALLACLALVAGACSSPRVADDQTASNSAGKQGDGRGKKQGKGNRKGKGTNAAEKAIGADAPDDPGADAAADESVNPQPLQALGPGGPEFARKSAHVEEPEPDAERGGPLVPDYAEAMAVDIQGLGKDLRVTFTMNGSVPERMPTERTIMVIAFGLSGPSEKHGGYAFGAQGRKDGWTAYAGAKNKTRRFPGTFFVRGNEIEMTVPWKFVEGPRPFEWYASASWFMSTGEENTTSYSFDVIPNGKGRFPN